MKIALLSDLHLEWSDFTVTNPDNADVLILAGDILIANDLIKFPANISDHARNRYQKFLANCSEQFEHVIMLAGNHEFYHGTFNQTINVLRAETNKYHNITFFENNYLEIDNVLFVGSTLWTDCNNSDSDTIRELPHLISDYRAITNDATGGKLNPVHTIARHAQSLDYLTTIVEANADKTVVVITHHSPSFKTVHPRFKDDTIMNGAFSSNLDDFIVSHPNIKLWCFGHTHNAWDFNIGATRLVCNPRGYHTIHYDEETGYNPTLTVDI